MPADGCLPAAILPLWTVYGKQRCHDLHFPNTKGYGGKDRKLEGVMLIWGRISFSADWKSSDTFWNISQCCRLLCVFWMMYLLTTFLCSSRTCVERPKKFQPCQRPSYIVSTTVLAPQISLCKPQKAVCATNGNEYVPITGMICWQIARKFLLSIFPLLPCTSLARSRS